MFVLVQLQQLDIFQDFESNNFLQKESPIPENSSGGKDVAERNVEGEKEGRSLGVVAGLLMFSVLDVKPIRDENFSYGSLWQNKVRRW